MDSLTYHVSEVYNHIIEYAFSFVRIWHPKELEFSSEITRIILEKDREQKLLHQS